MYRYRQCSTEPPLNTGTHGAHPTVTARHGPLHTFAHWVPARTFRHESGSERRPPPGGQANAISEKSTEKGTTVASTQDHPRARETRTVKDRVTIGADELAQQLSELARALQSEPQTGPMLDEVVAAAIRLIPGVDEGSISAVVARRQVSSQNHSGELPRLVDALQTEIGEGPCLDAIFEHSTVRVPDMATEDRWPRFAAQAAEAGAAAMLSFQLYVAGDNLGALNLYGRRPHAFDDESEHIGLLFASHAAVAFADAQRIDQLRQAVDSRDLIGQAKGILMERYTITPDQAFQLLSRVSQHTNRKLRDLAEQLVVSGKLPLTAIDDPR